MRDEQALSTVTLPGTLSNEAALWSVLDFVPMAVILLGADGKVRGMNAAAEMTLREVDALHDDRLHLALASRSVSRFSIRRTSKRPLQLSVIPLSRLTAIVIADSDRQPPNPEVLRRVYGLTPAEARVVAAMVRGSGGKKAAQELGISVNTLRRHLKSVFAKLHIERQSELVREVLLGAAALDLSALDS